MVLRWTPVHAGRWKQRLSKPDDTAKTYFAFFTETAIISQLSGRMLEEALPGGFLVSHFGVLTHLVRLGDGRTPMAIARAFQVPKTTMTHTLSGLEKAGLIRLEPNPRDGRSKRVMLTPEGRRFRDAAIDRLQPQMQRIAERFPPEKIEAMLPVLAEIRSYLDQLRDA
jgi:DNA-binding MarR family transcriptional regulator